MSGFQTGQKKTRKAQNFEVRNTVRADMRGVARADVRGRNEQRRAVSYGRARGNL